MQTLKEKQLAVLEDTCQHFNLTNRNNIVKRCLYTPLDNIKQGCAIGRLIPDKELCKKLDTMGAVKNTKDGLQVYALLPENLKQLGVAFLSELQLLHDNPDNWNSTGLTIKGTDRKEYIKSKIIHLY